MAAWSNETELFAMMKEKLYTPVVGDILDGLDMCINSCRQIYALLSLR